MLKSTTLNTAVDATGFDWAGKMLGAPGLVPSLCPVCERPMLDPEPDHLGQRAFGWMVSKDGQVMHNGRGCQFKVEL